MRTKTKISSFPPKPRTSKRFATRFAEREVELLNQFPLYQQLGRIHYGCGLSVLAAKLDVRCSMLDAPNPLTPRTWCRPDLEPAARAHIPAGEMWAPDQQAGLTVGRHVGW
jgi:hypothetical protein